MKTNKYTLAVGFTCASGTAVNDIVEIKGDMEVAAPSSLASYNIVGRVIAVTDNGSDDWTCTVDTKFRELRTDRVAGASVAVGAFVWNASGKVINYDSSITVASGSTSGVFTHNPAAVAGLIVTAGDSQDTVSTLEY